MSNKNNTLYQIPHDYSFVFGFYGRCDNTSTDEKCKSYNMNNYNFNNVVDSVFEVSGSQMSSAFSWYKSDISDSELNHFTSLVCGHIYYFILKPGTNSVEIPGLYITTNSSNDMYEFSNFGRVTTSCEFTEATPTPIISCCDIFDNSIITTSSKIGSENMNGVKTFGFEDGGTFCFNSLEINGLPGRFNFKTSDNSTVGYITTTGDFTSSEVRYSNPNGTCYRGYAEIQTGFNILTKL